MLMLPIILASSSPYRQQLLSQLGFHFKSISPDIDETPKHNESPKTLVSRLAQEKAASIRAQCLNHLIIGSDQVGALGDSILCKPGSHQKAVQQLQRCSQQQVTFYTGLCLLNTQSGKQQCSVESFTVHFRQLTDEQIERYLDQEKPYRCAGSFKIEGLGISLFSKTQGDDINTLVGLPLIKLVSMLNSEGITLP